VAYIIAEPCIGTKDTACVDVCPVDCIHPAKGRTYDDGRPTFDEVPQLYIDPTECIDCGACVPVCPVTAISRWMICRRSGTRTLRSTRITLTAVSFSPTSIKSERSTKTSPTAGPDTAASAGTAPEPAPPAPQSDSNLKDPPRHDAWHV